MMSTKRMIANKMRPIHPGEILKEELNAIGLSANAFAAKLHVPANRITSILNYERAISPETAIRLAQFFSTTPEFWLNLQSAFDLKITLIKVGKKIAHDVEPFADAV